MWRRRFVKNESRCTETNEGEDGEEAENPVGEDIYTAKRLCVITKLDKESAGVRCNVWFRWLVLLDGILGGACPCLFGEFTGRRVMDSNDKERCYCEERG